MRAMTIFAAIFAVWGRRLLAMAARAFRVFAAAPVMRIVTFLAILMALGRCLTLGRMAALAALLCGERLMFVVALVASAMALFLLGLRVDRLMTALAALGLFGAESMRRMAFRASRFAVEIRVAMRGLMAA